RAPDVEVGENAPGFDLVGVGADCSTRSVFSAFWWRRRLGAGFHDELGRVLARDSAGGHLFGGGVHGQMRDGEHPADRKIRAEESFSLSTFEESLHSSLGHLVHLTNTRCR